MSNPYGLSDEQMAAYSAQIAEERRDRQQAEAEFTQEFIDWLRMDAAKAERIKFGYPPEGREP